MKQTNGMPVDLTRYVLEILFAGTLVAAFVTKLINSNEIYWNSQFFGWEAGLNHSLHRSYNDHLGQNLAFGIISTALTAVGFLLLRALSRFALTTGLLRTVGGAVMVAAAPTCLWFVGWYRPEEPLWGGACLRLEGCAAAGVALLCASKRWGLSARSTATLLTLHSGLWFYAYSVTFQPFGFCWLTVPVIAYFATMTWAYWLKYHGQQQTSPPPT